MDEIEYERAQEEAARGKHAQECLQAIISQHTLGDTVASLARSAYKYTDCGAALGVLVYPGRWVYGSLHDVKPDDFICALSISSIVEGVEVCTSTHIVDLFDPAFETPDHAVAAYAAALAAVEAEAQEIWDGTHGCPSCAKHWLDTRHDQNSGIEGDDGITPVWAECPDCGGHGSII
jgi:hypothetical protein